MAWGDVRWAEKNLELMVILPLPGYETWPKIGNRAQDPLKGGLLRGLYAFSAASHWKLEFCFFLQLDLLTSLRTELRTVCERDKSCQCCEERG